ncbi:pentatricopeptide repeat-containing protein At2g26790, mitochondrial-like [Trifolium pratense]|uniref:pentatricopeptide repeat-containing protein At2g26790, mitochondrial-like n=1 Tax=Trifolium pratense TaxID=57577 RepID=UPI001E6937D6|nr:pentatricopeptide repeat-containing protein At2g26790, mitochondrial-like [Trifolium pratense]XP_045795713.1 pentatricopeptide repeat-containing protein At2g26790, mitochondrial-like [Trifolium pratense]XP_045795714.1 pentatricopeptide repeat-containing protein At2g26790, mitochondrial-like [Trifolium pratense]XP_045795715.1 pentatricopeptide repeat-containing protein At2g26790, mitochondrial-like [Trifolium pratense]XP_045795716.1 pentatricopeptide repeat-containing protein At2g26790, mitoc
MLCRLLHFPSFILVSLFKKSFSKTKTIHYNKKFNFSSSTSLALSSSQTHFTKPSNFSSFDPNTFKVLQKLYLYRNNPSLALSYFTQLNQHGFTHNIQTYASFIRILCYWNWNTSLDNLYCDIITRCSEQNPLFEIHELFEKLVESVDFDNKNCYFVRAFDGFVKAYVGLNMFDESVEFLFQFQIERFRIFPSMFACNFLINRLVNYDKIDMALDVYGRIKRLGLCPNLHTYGIVIKALCKKVDSLKYVVRVFDEMKDAGVTPNSYCYEAYIDGLCNNRMSDLGYHVLQYHRKRNAPIEVYAYATVIRGFCNEMKLDKAEDVFYDMKWEGLVLDFHVYSSLIRGYCKSNDLGKAFKLHDDMISKGIETNYVIASCILHCTGEMGMDSEVVDTFKELKRSGVFLDGVAYNIVFNSLCKLGKVDEAVGMLEELKSMHINVDIKHYTTFISGYCLQGKPDVAYSTFKEMEENGLKPDVVAYNVLLAGLFRNRRDCEAVDLLSHMDSQGVKPNSTTHKITIEGLCSAGKVEDAEAYFNCRKDEGVEIYTAMVNGYCQAGHIENSYELFCEISNQGDIAKEGSGFKQLSKVMYSKVLSALCQEIQKKEKEKESALCQEIQKKEKESALCQEIKKNIKEIALCQARNMKNARSLFDFFLEKGFTPDVVTYTIMIKSYCIMNCSQEAHHLFQDMEIRGIKPDVITYTVLLDEGLKQFYYGHRKGKDAKYNVLTIWGDMKQMGISPDVVTYTVMIDGHMKIHNLENAIIFFKEMIALRLEPDIVTYTALVFGLLNEGYTENAVMKEITPPLHIISELKRQIIKFRKRCNF